MDDPMNDDHSAGTAWRTIAVALTGIAVAVIPAVVTEHVVVILAS